MITVVVADDHPMVRAGLRAVLGTMPDIELIAEADTGEQAVAAVVEHHPDLVVMDLHMPGMGGLEATNRIRAASSRTVVLVLTMDEEDAALFAALQAGACGYLVKGAGYDEVRAAVAAAAAGEAVFGPTVASRVLGVLADMRLPDDAERIGLSEREREVLNLLTAGHATHDVARRLRLSPKTVRNHVSSILAKLHVPDRAQAIAWAQTARLDDGGTSARNPSGPATGNIQDQPGTTAH
ncbi:MAG: response regulator transcription factor [Gemmatimonadota bacterium]|nr:response regulator transcription factor [Gemmatimonadota bacterium]